MKKLATASSVPERQHCHFGSMHKVTGYNVASGRTSDTGLGLALGRRRRDGWVVVMVVVVWRRPFCWRHPGILCGCNCGNCGGNRGDSVIYTTEAIQMLKTAKASVSKTGDMDERASRAVLHAAALESF